MEEKPKRMELFSLNKGVPVTPEDVKRVEEQMNGEEFIIKQCGSAGEQYYLAKDKVFIRDKFVGRDNLLIETDREKANRLSFDVDGYVVELSKDEIMQDLRQQDLDRELEEAALEEQMRQEREDWEMEMEYSWEGKDEEAMKETLYEYIDDTLEQKDLVNFGQSLAEGFIEANERLTEKGYLALSQLEEAKQNAEKVVTWLKTNGWWEANKMPDSMAAHWGTEGQRFSDLVYRLLDSLS